MKLRDIFLGKPVHWLPWPIIAVLMAWMNSVHFHVLRFNMYALSLLAMSAAVVAFVLLTSRRGEQLTREPLAEERDVAGTGGED